MKKTLLFLFVALCGTTIGCATITTGRTQKVSFDSDPQEATVKLSSGYTGVTPCSFDLLRKKEHVAKISKDGYKTAVVHIKKTLSGATAGNAIVGGIIGIGVDAMSGACFKLVPEDVYVQLIKGNPDEEITIEPSKEVKKEEKEEAKPE